MKKCLAVTKVCGKFQIEIGVTIEILRPGASL